MDTRPLARHRMSFLKHGPRASARSPCKGRSDRGLSQSSVLLSAKGWCHLYIINKVNAFGIYVGTSSVWISWGLNFLRVNKRTTALCSIERLDGHAGLSFLEKPIFRIIIKLSSNKICQTKEHPIFRQVKSINLAYSQDSSSYKPLYELSDLLRSWMF
jgi:hypothetical protein